jgi:hypothetical protein
VVLVNGYLIFNYSARILFGFFRAGFSGPSGITQSMQIIEDGRNPEEKEIGRLRRKLLTTSCSSATPPG